MAKRGLLNLALLGLLAALAAWIWHQRQAPAPERLSRQDPKAVQRITIERADVTVVLERRDGRWWMLAPREFPAHRDQVKPLLQLLGSRSSAHYAKSQVDLAAAGLAPPRLTVSFGQERFALGSIEPLGSRRYVLRDEQIYLVEEGVSGLLSAPWWGFLSRRLLPDGSSFKALHLPDGRHLDAETTPRLAARWQEVRASLVRPVREGVTGQELVVELTSGERLPWLLPEGESRLVRPDQGLTYLLSPETLAVLLGEREWRGDADDGVGR